MSELIDREMALIFVEGTRPRVKWQFGKCILKEYFNNCKRDMMDAIRNVPAEDAEWVRHGYWITVGKTEKGSTILQCSICNRERAGAGKSAYCRDCGAKMHEVDELCL